MLEFRLLGQFDVRIDGKPVDLASRPAQNLLAYLLLTPGQPHRREQLATLFWPDAPDANARANLRHALWRLRNAIDPSSVYLTSDTQVVTFELQPGDWLDTEALQQEFSGEWPTPALMDVVSVYNGELLPGVYAEWADLERERLRDVFERQMAALLDRLTAERQWAEVRQWSERWLGVNRASEPAFRGMMTAHAAQGDMSGLATAYQRCIDVLRDELGLSPSPQTRALYDQLLKGIDLPNVTAAPALAPAPEPAPVAPPPVIAAPKAALLNNLPSQPTPFIGREDLLDQIAAQLADPGCRLITLTGPGGIGKTRLSLQAASNHISLFADGVFFVPLAPVGATDLIIPAIANALSITLYGGMDSKEQLFNYLRERHMLLVLDNFEHLVEGADMIAELLERAPRIQCLVSSRERLNIHGEWLLSVEGLRVPETDTDGRVETYSAVQMFVQSARRAQAGFQLAEADKPRAAQLCRLVQGLPLAIELAATWVRTISLREIVAEMERNLDFLSTSMRDMPQRHRSLRAVFDHSWNLLSPEEQRAFARLSVFRGGFPREAAEAVTGASLPVLSALMDKSLLRRNSAERYEIHELLRQYALGKLTDSREEPEIRNRHLAYYLEMADAAEPLLRQHEQTEWLARLETERDNLRVALKWAKNDEQIEHGLQLSGALTRFWYLHGYWQEGRDWLTTFLKISEVMDETGEPFLRARMRALHGAGWLQDESGAELEFYRQSLALSQQLGDKWGEAFSIRGMYSNLFNSPAVTDYASAHDELQKSLHIFETLKDNWGIGLVKFNLGWLAYAAEDHNEKDLWWQQSLESFRKSGDRWGMGAALSALGYAARYAGDYKRSADIATESLQYFREVGDRAGIADALARLASVSYRRSDYKQAIEIYEESLALTREMGSFWDQAQITAVIGLMRAFQGQFERAEELLNDSLQMAEESAGREVAAFIIDSVATAAYLKGDLERARTLWEETEASFRAMDDSVALAYTLNNLGMLAIYAGNYDRAEILLNEGHERIQSLGEKRGIALSFHNLARLAHSRGDSLKARKQFIQALHLRYEMGDKRGVAETLEGLAAVLAAAANMPDAQVAAEYLGLAEHLRERIGIHIASPERELRDRALAVLHAALGPAAFDEAHARGRQMLFDDALREILAGVGDMEVDTYRSTQVND